MTTTRPLFTDQELLDALLYVAPQDPEPSVQVGSLGHHLHAGTKSVCTLQSDGTTSEEDKASSVLISDEFADILSVFSGAEDGASSLTELLFADAADWSEAQTASRKRTRVSRSRQLSDMRRMADALEAKLEDLKSHLYADKPETGRFWQRIAQRMLVEKRLAVRENARLQGLLRQQVESVRALHSAFAKTPELVVRPVARLLPEPLMSINLGLLCQPATRHHT